MGRTKPVRKRTTQSRPAERVPRAGHSHAERGNEVPPGRRDLLEADVGAALDANDLDVFQELSIGQAD